MRSFLRLGVIGDYDPGNPYHPATTEALEHAAAALQLAAVVEWLPTRRLVGEAALPVLERQDGLLAGPGSPYRSLEGALDAIRFARVRGRPFAGT